MKKLALAMMVGAALTGCNSNNPNTGEPQDPTPPPGIPASPLVDGLYIAPQAFPNCMMTDEMVAGDGLRYYFQDAQGSYIDADGQPDNSGADGFPVGYSVDGPIEYEVIPAGAKYLTIAYTPQDTLAESSPHYVVDSYDVAMFDGPVKVLTAFIGDTLNTQLGDGTVECKSIQDEVKSFTLNNESSYQTMDIAAAALGTVVADSADLDVALYEESDLLVTHSDAGQLLGAEVVSSNYIDDGARYSVALPAPQVVAVSGQAVDGSAEAVLFNASYVNGPAALSYPVAVDGSQQLPLAKHLYGASLVSAEQTLAIQSPEKPLPTSVMVQRAAVSEQAVDFPATEMALDNVTFYAKVKAGIESGNQTLTYDAVGLGNDAVATHFGARMYYVGAGMSAHIFTFRNVYSMSAPGEMLVPALPFAFDMTQMFMSEVTGQHLTVTDQTNAEFLNALADGAANATTATQDPHGTDAFPQSPMKALAVNDLTPEQLQARHQAEFTAVTAIKN